jgi:hypothetical protein
MLIGTIPNLIGPPTAALPWLQRARAFQSRLLV